MRTSIVMYVKHTVEPCIDDVVDHLMHTLHPCSINIAVAINMGIPGDRHSDGSETSLLHHCDQFRLCDRLAPVGF